MRIISPVAVLVAFEVEGGAVQCERVFLVRHIITENGAVILLVLGSQICDNGGFAIRVVAKLTLGRYADFRGSAQSAVSYHAVAEVNIFAPGINGIRCQIDIVFAAVRGRVVNDLDISVDMQFIFICAGCLASVEIHTAATVGIFSFFG